MKYPFVMTAGVALLASQSDAQRKLNLKTSVDSVSYAIGMDIARNFQMQNVSVNVEALAAGMKAKLGGAKLALTDAQAQSCMTAFQERMMAKHQEEAAKAGEVHRKEGDAFLAANKTKEGVVTTASGLQYKVITMGTGPKPTPAQTVTVHYKGTTLDGKEFDSSFKRGQPAEFGLTQEISGWVEGIQLMPVGSKFEFYIPSNLAYGNRGSGENIPPGATLIFEVELLGVK